jgi:putative membrane protein insertion efficiency factor
VYGVRQQPIVGEQNMPSLRQPLKNPNTWLVIILSLVILGLLDAARLPADQITGHLFVGGVRLYQRYVRPVVSHHVRCRYHPSCSDYSIGAVQKHGIGSGLFLTMKRLFSCTRDVPLGTFDPVPSADEGQG